MIVNKELEQREAITLRSGEDLIRYSKRFAVEDRRKSWIFTITTLIFLVGAFVTTYYNFHWSFKLVSSILTALFMVKFFVIYHDYQHRAIFEDSILAKIIMKLFGIFILAPTNVWKRTHDHHHNHNSKLSNDGIGSYPLLSKSAFNKLSGKQRFLYLVSRHPITIFLGYITLFIYDFNVNSLIRSPKKHWDSFLALVFHFAVAGLLFNIGGLDTLIFSWILPFLLAHGFGSYLFYAQHNFPGAVFEENKNWKYTQAALHSTSFLLMNPIMNWFTGNIGYHHVHHVNHRIPFYRLREAMQSMPELHNPLTTTLKPGDMLACLKLKIWDPDKRQMTGL